MQLLQPTAGQPDFQSIPGLPEAWSQFLNDIMEWNIYGRPNDSALAAVEELKLWGRSDADLRFYNPLSISEPTGSVSRQVNWKALPTSFDARFGDDREALYAFLDSPHKEGRIQDEYCEWVVLRDAGSRKITKVIFTSEPSAYYEMLFNDYYGVGKERTRKLLLDLYSQRCEGAAVTLDQISTPDGQRYDPWNSWNNKFAVHMQQPNNTLGAQINIAAISAILRQDKSGRLITSPLSLIRCGKYGDENRQSDPSIGAAVNTFARENRFIALEDPVGLYMTDLDTTGWVTPDGSDPAGYWKVIKGTANQDPDKAMVVRAEYSVPSTAGFTVSDIKIAGVPIRFGAQIAAKVNMRLGVRVSGQTGLPLPRGIGCKRDKPILLSAVNPAVMGMAETR